MLEFTYILTDEYGIHARPASLLVKKALEFSSSIIIKNGNKKADAKRLFAVMGLTAKQGDKLYITVSGSDEELAVSSIKKLLDENL